MCVANNDLGGMPLIDRLTFRLSRCLQITLNRGQSLGIKPVSGARSGELDDFPGKYSLLLRARRPVALQNGTALEFTIDVLDGGLRAVGLLALGNGRLETGVVKRHLADGLKIGSKLNLTFGDHMELAFSGSERVTRFENAPVKIDAFACGRDRLWGWRRLQLGAFKGSTPRKNRVIDNCLLIVDERDAVVDASTKVGKLLGSGFLPGALVLDLIQSLLNRQ